MKLNNILSMKLWAGLLVLAAPFALPQALAQTAHAKYGPQATRLFQNQTYVRKNPAPDFWALMPYYIHQQDGRSCSVASVTMVMNAARASMRLTASDELVTQKGIIDKVKNDAWSKGVGEGGKGVDLDTLGKIVEQALAVYGLKGTVQVIHADPKAEAKSKKQLHDLLITNELSDQNFIIANFLQSEYTGDPEGAVGHIAPVAAYNAAQKQVLIFDPDRQYYEPYWISEEVFFKGMATTYGSSGKTRGYVWLQLQK